VLKEICKTVMIQKIEKKRIILVCKTIMFWFHLSYWNSLVHKLRIKIVRFETKSSRIWTFHIFTSIRDYSVRICNIRLKRRNHLYFY